MPEKQRAGFVSTRLSGSDGVSLETRKWVAELEKLGVESFFFAGESEWPEQRSYIVPEAHFTHPDIRALNQALFGHTRRSPETSRRVAELTALLKTHLHRFIDRFDLDLLIAENALSLPMNIPLGLALTEIIAETQLPTIGHHHDFAWERSRYKVSAATDYQMGAFPPILPAVHHVVINSYAARQLALRTGANSTLIPNVMDFDSPPPEPDDYIADLRQNLGVPEDAYFILQPTRIVPRKRIEMAIELVRRLNMNAVLVISHASGDEGDAYANYLREYADLMGVHVLFAADRFAYERGRDAQGRKIYSLADAYQAADLVTYPSRIEGFGNAFLEAIYYRRPIVLSTYEIFRIDIQPKGFKVIGFDDFITEDCVMETRKLLQDPKRIAEMTEHNFRLGKRYYSYQTLSKRLNALIGQCLGD
ncbi:MAG: glycosyltransferase family 4 protein [Chloroflexi bacterium]|nr:glycosyltransferase family 4 protein [Chloroflexota bacterium]